jgi:hypothetical protein
MTTEFQRKIGALIASCFCVGVVHATPPSQQDRSVRELQLNAYERAGLSAAAAITGSCIGAVPKEDGAGAPATLAELAGLSPVIVTGQSIDGICKLSIDARQIYTVHDVVIASVLKGSFKAGDHIAVAVPGGRVSFPDKSWAELRTPGFARPSIGRLAVWFLRPAGKQRINGESGLPSSGLWVLSHGSLGLYDLELRVSNYVLPAGQYSSFLARGLLALRLTPSEFVQRVREVVQ